MTIKIQKLEASIATKEFPSLTEKVLIKDSDYLDRFYQFSDTKITTVLNFLIEQQVCEEESSFQYEEKIDFILAKMKNPNLGNPVHLALMLDRIDLVFKLLNDKRIDVNQYNKDGQTILSLALTKKNPQLLQAILKRNPALEQFSNFQERSVTPLHQAVMQNLADEISILADANAVVNNLEGPYRETPVLLAAREKKWDSLNALLRLKDINSLSLEKESIENQSAIEILCSHLSKDSKNSQIISAIAKLLCSGAEPPRNLKHVNILSKRKAELLEAVTECLHNSPQLAPAFAYRCLLKESTLHRIIFSDSSVGGFFRHLVGKPGNAGFVVANWINDMPQNQNEDGASKAISPTNPKLQQYAKFVKIYDETYKNHFWTNPWSERRRKIAQGDFSWSDIEKQAAENPKSRTASVLNEMKGNKVELHRNIESLPNNSPL